MTRRARAPNIANPIDVIEAAYDLQIANQDWIRHVTAAIRPLLDGGRGISAYEFDMAVPLAQWLKCEVTFDVSPERLALQRKFQIAGAAKAEAMHVHPEPLGALLQESRRAGLGNILDDRGVRESFRAMDIRDYTAFRTIEPDGRGICINAGQQVERSFDARTLRLWARVAAHVAAARRLRAALAVTEAEHAIEAVFTPSGRLEHAEGEGQTPGARSALHEAVVRQERARGRQRREDPELATEAWTALVSGRWSLVDRYEHGGRRYIVARRNELAVADPRALTRRERIVVQLTVLGKTNKLIGYELGLASSTVATHVSSAMRKLGVASRVELIQFARHLGAP